jgi:Fur family ferric uptake transcriptional regulator
MLHRRFRRLSSQSCSRVIGAGGANAYQNGEKNRVRAMYATSTRRAVVDLLKTERRYLSAANIFAALKGGQPKLALSTVYRTLEFLQRIGSVSSRTEASGETAYVYCTDDHHHHAICTVCGHVDEVDCDAMESFKGALLRNQSFALDEHAIEFYGRCARCR